MASSVTGWLGRRRSRAPDWSQDGRKVVLHVGCGSPDHLQLHPRFRGADWRELRYDIDPRTRPDIVGSIADMSGVPAQSVDAVWSSHNLEHVYAHEVPTVLGEFYRVLRPGGMALITMPDLQLVAERIAAGRLEEPLYVALSGPVTPLDVVYGHGESLEHGNEYMAHRTGFTARSLAQKLGRTGFGHIEVERKEMALWATALRPAPA
jgi:SAM-dependent methyltransferase